MLRTVWIWEPNSDWSHQEPYWLHKGKECSSKEAAVCGIERCMTSLKTAAKKTKDSIFLFFGKNRKIEKWARNWRLFHFSHFSNNSKTLKNAKISLLAIYSIFCIFELNVKIRKMKKRSIFLTIFCFCIFFCTLNYVNMIRISNTGISFFRFC